MDFVCRQLELALVVGDRKPRPRMIGDETKRIAELFADQRGAGAAIGAAVFLDA